MAAACALTLLFLVGSTAIETGRGPWAALLLLIVGAVAALSALFVGDGAPWSARHWSAWLQPRPLALVFVAIFVGFGTMTDALALFEPRPAVESEAGAIEKGVNEIRAAVLPGQIAPARVRSRIVGIWGEPGCEVTYRFAVRASALTVEALRLPVGAEPFRLVATITREAGDVMNVTGEEPLAARGRAATFTYVTNGVTERLTWDDEVRPVPVELDRCT